MEQNDIVAKILQMLQGGGQAQPPMLAPSQLPGRPESIMPPSGPEMPESNDRIALQMALGQVPTGDAFPMGMMGGAQGGRTVMSDDPMAPGMDSPEIQALIAQQRKLMGPSQMSPQMRQFMELQKLQRPQQQQFTLPRPGPHSMIR